MNDSSNWLQRLFNRGATPPPGTFVAPSPEPSGALPQNIGDIVEGQRRYRLVRPLGAGAFGSVFLATPEGGGTPEAVAIKLLSGRLTHAARQDSLRRELSSLLAMDHPSIPRVYDWQLDAVQPFVVMEYFPEGSLLDVLGHEGMLPDNRVPVLLTALLSALDAARRACVLHLDIKPANVLVRADGGFALADFGTAQAAYANSDVVGRPSRGTLGYQAPELARKTPPEIDVRTDLYGVGATVWAAATGIDLGSARGQRLLVSRAELAHTLPPVSQFRPSIPAEIDAMLIRLLARDPALRPPGPAELLDALGQMGQAIAPRGHEVNAGEARMLREALLDPLWTYIISHNPGGVLVRFEAGEMMVEEGEASHHAYVLLRGQVSFARQGKPLGVEQREGAFLGEVAALTGGVRVARMEAVDTVWAVQLDVTGLERLVTNHPAVGMRLIHTMADRLSRSG